MDTENFINRCDRRKVNYNKGQIMEKSQVNPLVSVVVPLYNQEHYLDKCLRSICQQTYSNLEVIVVNDGSTDNSLSKANDWAAHDARILVIDKSNGGVSLARRDGLMKARGEFVAFVDSDDWLPLSSIEILVGHMLRHEVDLVIGSTDKHLGFATKHSVDKVYSFPYHQVVRQPQLFDDYYKGFYSNTVFHVAMFARLYRKRAIDDAMRETDLFDQEVNRMGEDLFFNVKLFPYLQSMYRTDETVYHYRYNGVTTRFNRNFPQLFVLADKRLELLDQYDYSQGYQSLYAEYVACLYRFGRQLIAYEQADKQGVMDFFKQELDNRRLVPRMLDYYAQNGLQRKEVQLIADRDYEGMYLRASEMLQANRRSLKFRIRRRILKLMGKW